MLKSRILSYFFIFGIIFTFISIPFFTGLLRPSFSERNPFALFYTFFELPITLFFNGVIRSLAEEVWDDPTIYQIDLMQFYFSLAVWCVIGAIFGLISDIRGNRA